MQANFCTYSECCNCFPELFVTLFSSHLAAYNKQVSLNFSSPRSPLLFSPLLCSGSSSQFAQIGSNIAATIERIIDLPTKALGGKFPIWTEFPLGLAEILRFPLTFRFPHELRVQENPWLEYVVLLVYTSLLERTSCLFARSLLA